MQHKLGNVLFVTSLRGESIWLCACGTKTDIAPEASVCSVTATNVSRVKDIVYVIYSGVLRVFADNTNGDLRTNGQSKSL